MDNKLMGFLINKEGTHGHRCLQLQRLPVGFMHLKRDGIVLDTRLSLLAQSSTLSDRINEFTGHGNLELWFL